MLFVETPIFTKLVTDLIPDDEYRKIQLALVLRPEAGKIIPGSGGPPENSMEKWWQRQTGRP